MVTIRITEGEFVRDPHAVLAKVRQGTEVVIEDDHKAVAVLRSPATKGRLISDCIALAESVVPARFSMRGS